MPADPRDDFAVLEGAEHMLFGLDDPYAVIRREVTTYLRQTTPDTAVQRIVVYGDPKWLTLTRRDGDAMPVTGFGLCMQARVTSVIGYASEQAAATVTLLCCRWDQPGRELVRAYVDFGTDAEPGFSDEAFQHRLFAFRHEVAPDDDLG
ncbi:MAG: hypothetical protein H0V17_07875 [Deltaproteobacteria bacterium]|nr:hypothetical protein [Deltaproteobacteria bacterium]